MIYLEDLIKTGDFNMAANKLIYPFREEFNLPDVDQLGVVVPDVEAAAKDLESKGCGSFFIAQGKASFWQERGEDKTMQSKLGIAYLDNIEIELLEPGTGSDFYRQSLDPGGKPVVQHIGFQVPDLEEKAAEMAKKSDGLYVRGQIKFGPSRTEFAYMDTIEKTGFILEYITHHFLGKSTRPPQALFHSIGFLQKLTGKRCFTI
jgi:Glyoxalase/Bleomycin resistance protein/Dioxygenase superfamily